ncbi:MAG: hypothetical protein K6T78_14060 [Alicyclobacillus sp.]|nr:hypothetical protein [Alicyclobacillus sp.]
MAVVILVGAFNSNTPQQNAGSFFGEWNLSGWDANMKMSLGHGGTFGAFNSYPINFNLNLDNFEVVDGAINDPDFKPEAGTNV